MTKRCMKMIKGGTTHMRFICLEKARVCIIEREKYL